jgi:hypothetical protein
LRDTLKDQLARSFGSRTPRREPLYARGRRSKDERPVAYSLGMGTVLCPKCAKKEEGEPTPLYDYGYCDVCGKFCGKG